MPVKKPRPEGIIKILREAEVLVNQGLATPQAARQLGITDKTYYRWRKEIGGMRVDQPRKLKEPERENNQLKRLMADLSLDNQILKEVARGNF